MENHSTLKERIHALDFLKDLKKREFKGDVYLVGGTLRELFLSSTPHDYDFAITDREDVKVFEDVFSSKAFLIGKKPFHTYRIVKGNTNIDLTQIERDILEDLKRRDFTINAIAYDVREDRIIDPLNGLNALREKVIIHISRENLIHDPLRMLKAIRHFATLDGFIIHNELLREITELKNLIGHVAYERIKNELDQIIISRNAFYSLKLMEKTGLLFEIFPELYTLKKFDEEKKLKPEILGHTIFAFNYLHSHGVTLGIEKKMLKIVGYALLFHDLGKPYTFSYDLKNNAVHFFYHEKFSVEIANLIMERLRFSTYEIRMINTLIKHHMRVFLISRNVTERAIRRIIFKMKELTPPLLLMTVCDMYGSTDGKDNESTEKVLNVCKTVLKNYKEFQEEPLPKLVTGYDLIEIGYKEGPQLGRCLNEIREKQISGEIKTKEEALNYAKAKIRGN